VRHIEQIGIKLFVTLRTIFLNFINQSFSYHPKGCTSYVPQISLQV